MERETGIEPATNSLEGCDSTTELLPPARPAALRLLAPWRGKAADSLPCPVPALPSRRSRESERRVVARGGFEPPKA